MWWSCLIYSISCVTINGIRGWVFYTFETWGQSFCFTVTFDSCYLVLCLVYDASRNGCTWIQCIFQCSSSVWNMLCSIFVSVVLGVQTCIFDFSFYILQLMLFIFVDLGKKRNECRLSLYNQYAFHFAS